MVSPMASNHKHSFRAPPPPITAAFVALRLGNVIHHRFHPAFFFHSSLKRISLLGDVPRLKDLCRERAIQFTGFNCFRWSLNGFSATLMGLSFFNGNDSGSGSNDFEKSQSSTSKRALSHPRPWTNTLLAANVLVYVAQMVSKGKLLNWGAKVNCLISKGQLWRLVTSCFLHVDIAHLLVNCYSLNTIGPAVEHLSGPQRFLTIYISSAVTSSTMSYFFNKSPSVGASGAIFGLLGSYAIYILRNKEILKETDGHLKYIAQVLVINMAFGLLSKRIDNWGHVGGFIGGAAVSWFVGPAWELQSITPDGIKVYADKPPIGSLIIRKDTPK